MLGQPSFQIDRIATDCSIIQRSVFDLLCKKLNEKMTITAWYMDDDLAADQRAEHKQDPSVDAPLSKLAELGVLHWSGIFGGDEDEQLIKIKAERGYTYTDTIYVSPEKLPNYEG